MSTDEYLDQVIRLLKNKKYADTIRQKLNGRKPNQLTHDELLTILVECLRNESKS